MSIRADSMQGKRNTNSISNILTYFLSRVYTHRPTFLYSYTLNLNSNSRLNNCFCRIPVQSARRVRTSPCPGINHSLSYRLSEFLDCVAPEIMPKRRGEAEKFKCQAHFWISCIEASESVVVWIRSLYCELRSITLCCKAALC